MKRDENRNLLLRKYNSDEYIRFVASAKTEEDLLCSPYYSADEAARYMLHDTVVTLAKMGVFISPIAGTRIWDLFLLDLDPASYRKDAEAD